MCTLDKLPHLLGPCFFLVKWGAWTGWCVSSLHVWNLWNWKHPIADLVSLRFPVANNLALIIVRKLEWPPMLFICFLVSSPNKNSLYYSHQRITSGGWTKDRDIYNGPLIHSLIWVSEGRSGLVSLLTRLKEFHHPLYLPSMNGKGMRCIEVVLETSFPSLP